MTKRIMKDLFSVKDKPAGRCLNTNSCDRKLNKTNGYKSKLNFKGVFFMCRFYWDIQVENLKEIYPPW